MRTPLLVQGGARLRVSDDRAGPPLFQVLLRVTTRRSLPPSPRCCIAAPSTPRRPPTTTDAVAATASAIASRALATAPPSPPALPTTLDTETRTPLPRHRGLQAMPCAAARIIPRSTLACERPQSLVRASQSARPRRPSPHRPRVAGSKYRSSFKTFLNLTAARFLSLSPGVRPPCVCERGHRGAARARGGGRGAQAPWSPHADARACRGVTRRA